MIISYIYILEKNNTPFYVGKTNNPYLRESNHKRKFGKDISFCVIDEVDEQQWKFWECFYIDLFKNWGFNLSNKNKGGGGVQNHSKEAKEKIAATATPILQYDENGNFVKEYKNALEALRQNGWKSTSGNNITECCKGNFKSAYGYLWKLKESDNIPLKINQTIKKKNKPIMQYDLEGNFIKEWESSRAVAKSTKGWCDVYLRQCIKQNKPLYGFLWKDKN